MSVKHLDGIFLGLLNLLLFNQIQMKKYQLFISLIALITTLYSCNDKDPIPGPQGPAGKSVNLNPYLKDGYVKGKIYSTGNDGKDTLIGEFNYQYIYSNQSSSYKRGNDPFLSIVRQDSAEDGNLFYLYSYIDIASDTIKPGPLFYLNFSYVKDLGNGKYLKFGEANRVRPFERSSIGGPWQESSLSISNYTFNQATGNLKFDFEILYTANETLSGKKSKVTGSLDVNLKEEVPLRTGNLTN